MYTVYVVWDAEEDLDACAWTSKLSRESAERWADYLIENGAFFAWAERD
jgi:hypothetical protein